ncbi:MAG: hypothetical protein JO270_17945 [Acidobacteriaceae bacterium]|nr:hypothetical protein [Acidobacteriaceae bacterium]
MPMTTGDFGMMRRFFVIASLVMLCCLLMMSGCMLVMLCRLTVVLSTFVTCHALCSPSFSRLNKLCFQTQKTVSLVSGWPEEIMKGDYDGAMNLQRRGRVSLFLGAKSRIPTHHHVALHNLGLCAETDPNMPSRACLRHPPRHFYSWQIGATEL